jgi:NADP-dependent 3-hydroxy acid dehydrogenase YdfG
MADGRVAIVTGASSGIGRAVTCHFVQRGMRVVAAGRNAAQLGKLVDALAGQPGAVLPVRGDMTEPGHTEELLAAADQRWEAPTIFVASARQDGGRQARDIVVIGSTVGRQVSAANPVYGSTKFALHSLVEALRQEICAYGIRVTLIEPGFVRSGFQEAAGYDMEWFERVAEEYGPLLTPDDVAETITFVVERPRHVHLDDIRLRPTRQKS